MRPNEDERDSIFDDEHAAVNHLHGEWVADPQPEQRCCVRYGLLIVNTTLFVAAVVLVAAGLLAKGSSISKICVECKDISTAATVVGGIFLGSSLIGFLALMRRAVGFLVVYFITVVLLMLAVIGLTIAGIVMSTNGVDLSKEWRTRVAEQNPIICQIQENYKCSGWTQCCGAHDQVNQTEDDCKWSPLNCLSQCGTTNMMTDSCESAVQTWLKTILVPFIIGMLVVLMLICFGGHRSKQLRRTVRAPA